MNQEKNIQNKYRIEPLEPRLMMDASVDDWHAEIDSINVSTSYSVNQFTAFENEPVEGLYQTTEDGLKQATIKDLLELNEIFDDNLSSASPNGFLQSVKNRLNAAVGSAQAAKLQELHQAALDAGGGFRGCPTRRGGDGSLALDPIAALQGDNRASLQSGGGFPLFLFV